MADTKEALQSLRQVLVAQRFQLSNRIVSSPEQLAEIMDSIEEIDADIVEIDAEILLLQINNSPGGE